MKEPCKWGTHKTDADTYICAVCHHDIFRLALMRIEEQQDKIEELKNERDMFKRTLDKRDETISQILERMRPLIPIVAALLPGGDE